MSSSERRRVAVIGGTGCGGRAVVAALRPRHEVLVLSRGLAAGPAPDVVCDRRDAVRLGAVLRKFAPDVVVDQVAFDAQAVDDVPAAAVYILISSAAVYGPPRARPWREDDEPRPESSLGLGKRAAEEVALARPGTTVCLRLGALYGPGQAPLTPLGRDAELAKRLARGEPMLVPEGTAPVQPWFSGDHGGLVATLVTHPSPPPILNAAGDERLTWDEIFDAWAAACGAPAPQIERRAREVVRASAPAHVAPFLDMLWDPPSMDVARLHRVAPGLGLTPFAEGTRRTFGG